MPVAALSHSHLGSISDSKQSAWSLASAPAPAPGFAASPIGGEFFRAAADLYRAKADDSDARARIARVEKVVVQAPVGRVVVLTPKAEVSDTPPVGSLPAHVALKLDAVLAIGQAQDAARTAEAASSLRAELAGRAARQANKEAKAAAEQSARAMDETVIAEKVVDKLTKEINKALP